MFDAIVTALNRLAARGRCRRFWGVATEVFWVDKIRLYEFDGDIPDDPPDAGACWRVATEADVDAMLRAGDYDIRADFMKSFVRSDREELILGTENGAIRTYAVCATEKKRMNGPFFRLEGDEAFISVCFTHPRSRGRGWGPKCIDEIRRRCREKGIDRVFIDISTSNAASIRSALKAGARETDTWYYRIRIWKRDRIIPFGSYKSRFYKGEEPDDGVNGAGP